MHYEWYHGAIAIAAGIVLILIALILWIRRSPLPKLPESPALPLPLEPIHLQYKTLHGVNSHSRALADQSEEWRASMKRSGSVLKSAQVKHIMLLHGTFVGSDPVNMLSSLKTYFPKISERFESGMSKSMRGLIDQLAQDNGNFIPAYAELLEQALDAKIPVRLHYWSSGNHHLARLEGALSLIENLAQNFSKKSSDRILLLGHSHARQVFALFTQLIQGSNAATGTGAKLWKFVAKEGLASPTLQAQAKSLRKQRFDFVTLGGPVRYPWAFIPEMRALHIVNHRGDTSSVTASWNFWNATSGDFVQQWGMIGSDNFAGTPRERAMNRDLDDLLGKGWHTRLWLKSIVRRERLGDFGRTLLIDYQAEVVNRNFIKSVFGHGVYTRFDVMDFQMELICRYIYL